MDGKELNDSSKIKLSNDFISEVINAYNFKLDKKQGSFHNLSELGGEINEANRKNNTDDHSRVYRNVLPSKKYPSKNTMLTQLFN